MNRPATVPLVAALTGVLAAGCVLMAIAHLGIRVPVVSALGPGGNQAIPPAAAAFTIAALLFAVVTAGIVRGRAWSWPTALVLHALALLGAAVPYRGVGSAVGIALTGAAIAVLLTPSARRALLA